MILNKVLKILMGYSSAKRISGRYLMKTLDKPCLFLHLVATRAKVICTEIGMQI
jgi:hypothetical protein